FFKFDMELTDEQNEVFAWAFNILNRDKDGSLAPKDLERFMKALGKQATDSQLNSMINETNVSGNGFINYEEFVATVGRRLRGNVDDDELRDAFSVYDKENTGYVTSEQIRSVFIDLDVLLTEDEVEDIIRAYDQDGDSKLSYEEFVLMMTTL
ncbi:hypothetical protein KR222_002253, partial [Zaprionus bogoriensis]